MRFHACVALLRHSLRWHYPDQVTGSVSHPDTLSAGCPSSPGLLCGCRFTLHYSRRAGMRKCGLRSGEYCRRADRGMRRSRTAAGAHARSALTRAASICEHRPRRRTEALRAHAYPRLCEQARISNPPTGADARMRSAFRRNLAPIRACDPFRRSGADPRMRSAFRRLPAASRPKCVCWLSGPRRPAASRARRRCALPRPPIGPSVRSRW